MTLWPQQRLFPAAAYDADEAPGIVREYLDAPIGTVGKTNRTTVAARPDFNYRPTLRIAQSEQHRFRIVLAADSAGRENGDLSTHPSLRIDDLERATAQNRERSLLRESKLHVIDEICGEQNEIQAGEANQQSFAEHMTPRWTLSLWMPLNAPASNLSSES